MQHAMSNIDGLVQDCSNSSALAMELLQSCTKPLINAMVMFSTNTNNVYCINKIYVI